MKYSSINRKLRYLIIRLASKSMENSSVLWQIQRICLITIMSFKIKMMAIILDLEGNTFNTISKPLLSPASDETIIKGPQDISKVGWKNESTCLSLHETCNKGGWVPLHDLMHLLDICTKITIILTSRIIGCMH